MRLPFALALAGLLLAGPATFGADSESHRKAAEELFKAMELPKQLDTSINQMIDLQAKSNPALANVRPTMKRFFAKYMAFDSLKDDLVKIYTESFTEKELRELTEFYNSPLGKKLAKVTPDLTRKSAELGMKRVQANMAELQKMIAEDMDKK